MSDTDFARFPTEPGAWADFVTGGTEDRIAAIRDLDARIVAGDALTAQERLALWNEADLVGTQALSTGYVLSDMHPDAEVRALAESAAERVEALLTERRQSRELWEAIAAIDPTGLGDEWTRLRDHVLRDFRRGGVELPDDVRDRLRQLAERDTALSLAFARNIREGRREIRLRPEQLDGLPDDFREAHPVGDDGLVTLSTDYPDLLPMREYATDRAARTVMTETFNDLAWPENDPVLAELVAVRHERATTLGHLDWADYETETRMIGAGPAIPQFLDRLDEASREAAAAEYDRLLARLQRDDPDTDVVTQADFLYLVGALKREEYDVDAQLVRSYLPFDRVLPGVLDVTGRLFDVSFHPVETTTWHEDVRSYDVHRGDELLGRIHLDLHPREGKYNHAACFPMTPGVAGRALPEGGLVCNFSRGQLEHDDVVTFFHEFGHLMHHVLGGRGQIARFSGFEVEWDFVEAPSQMLEEWAWDADVLASLSADADGRPIPADLVARMRVADGFGRALGVRRQLGYARTSYLVHVERPADLQAAAEGWVAATSPVQPLPDSHFYAGFGHLTQYGACYYTYQWSLVIARDLLSAFGGDLLDPEVARRYRERVLEPGGTRDATDLVESFLGRPYRFDAYADWLAAEPPAPADTAVR